MLYYFISAVEYKIAALYDILTPGSYEVTQGEIPTERMKGTEIRKERKEEKNERKK